jgi:hypothetical protein
LDDLWEEEHETELNFVDVSQGSKVLISTRVKGLLGGGHRVEVGLPSAADSARMLLAAAGAGDARPTELMGVGEIVDLCGRLRRGNFVILPPIIVYMENPYRHNKLQ